MKTQGRKSWKYGKIEARIAMPAFQGAWPAFWMLGDSISSVNWPACGELDIMEHINTGGAVFGSTHWTGTDGLRADFSNGTSTSVTGYHVYTVEWTPTLIKWFVDGVQYTQFDITNGVGGTSEFHANFFILLNLAIGGDWPGGAVDNNAFPAKMYVDWVRVYQDNGAPSNNGGTPYFMLVNKASGKCADLINGNTANGSRINQWSYDYNSVNQRWSLVPTENGDHFKLVSWVSGKVACIANDSTADGAQLHEWDYVGNNPSQQWDLIDAGNGWFKIRNVRSGKILDLDASSTANDAKLEQWTDHNGANQLWRLQPQGDYFIRAASGKYVSVQGSGNANGSAIVQYSWANNPAFKWRIENVGEGNYRFSSLNALGRVISIVYGSTAAAANAHLWDYGGGGDQKMRIKPLTNGKFRFYFTHTGMDWDIAGGGTGNDVPLVQYPENSNSWQQFNLERVP